jgi:hypothetical protein
VGARLRVPPRPPFSKAVTGAVWLRMLSGRRHNVFPVAPQAATPRYGPGRPSGHDIVRNWDGDRMANRIIQSSSGIVANSGDVFADLGFPNADERQTKVRLSAAINSVLARRRLASLTPVLRAQSTNASLTGRITDPSRALIVNAKIAAISAGTNVHYATLTDGSGEYYLANLPSVCLGDRQFGDIGLSCPTSQVPAALFARIAGIGVVFVLALDR